MTPTRIFVAVDGSAGSDAAVHWAAGLAARCRAEVVLVHAVGLLEHLTEGRDARDHSEIEAVLERQWARPLSLAGIPFQVRIAEGRPAPVLLDLAASAGADLIVVGSRGAGQHPAGTLGSTSLEVASRAPCPVVVVPPLVISPDAPASEPHQ